MPLLDTNGERISGPATAWVLATALALFVAGAGMMLGADQRAVAGVGEAVAYGGILVLIGWLALRGTRQRVLYPAAGALLFAWFSRDVPSGGISMDDVRRMVIVVCIFAIVAGVVELWDRRKKSRSA